MNSSLEQLARLAQDGNRDALERLVEQIQDKVYGLALRMLWHPEDARDATQDILIRVITHLPFVERASSRHGSIGSRPTICMITGKAGLRSSSTPFSGSATIWTQDCLMRQFRACRRLMRRYYSKRSRSVARSVCCCVWIARTGWPISWARFSKSKAQKPQRFSTSHEPHFVNASHGPGPTS